MCGRFAITLPDDAMVRLFDAVPANDLPPGPRYNVCPTQPVAVVVSRDGQRHLGPMRWGFIPHWYRHPGDGPLLINARAEGIADKPAFAKAARTRRCLIPASGFYEWTKRDSGKVPMYIHLDDHAPFAFAGLWEVWHSPDGGEIHSCTILTTEPNDLIKPLHNRMAVILDEADYDMWLSPDELPADALKPMLRPYRADAMRAYEVSTLVNKPANDSPQCIVPMTPPEQPSLL